MRTQGVEREIAETRAEGLIGIGVQLGLWRFINGRVIVASEQADAAYEALVQRSRHVRFTADSGHSSVQVGCPKSAISRHAGMSRELAQAIARTRAGLLGGPPRASHRHSGVRCGSVRCLETVLPYSIH